MKLIYYKISGRAEAIRMLLHHAKVPYEDVFVEWDDWKQYRVNKALMTEKLGDIEYDTLPVLELDDGTRLSQTPAILFYLATVYGYMPTTPMGAYNATNLMTYLVDDVLYKTIQSNHPIFSPKDKLKEGCDAFLEMQPEFLANVERHIPEQGWIGGDNLTPVDFFMGNIIYCMYKNKDCAKYDILNPLWNEHAGPKTKAFAEKLRIELKDYLDSTPRYDITGAWGKFQGE